MTTKNRCSYYSTSFEIYGLLLPPDLPAEIWGGMRRDLNVSLLRKLRDVTLTRFIVDRFEACKTHWVTWWC
jgi:hypothetical protein